MQNAFWQSAFISLFLIGACTPPNTTVTSAGTPAREVPLAGQQVACEGLSSLCVCPACPNGWQAKSSSSCDSGQACQQIQSAQEQCWPCVTGTFANVDTSCNGAFCGGCKASCLVDVSGNLNEGGVCSGDLCYTCCGQVKYLTDKNGASYNTCDGNLTSLYVDPNNCGACGKSCPSGQACSEGQCQNICPSGTELCDGKCVSIADAESHCGVCGKKCDAGYTCQSGQCVVDCAGTTCGGVCVNPSNDDANCGTCGNKCAAGHCNGGSCACPAAGQTICSSNCVDTKSDAKNCGACGSVCSDSFVCSNGACVCPAGFTLCGGKCVNTAGDPKNCGACGKDCGNAGCINECGTWFCEGPAAIC